MNKRIQPTESTQKTIRDMSDAEPLIDLDRIAQSLGGESTGIVLKDAISPITLSVVREEIAKRLQSRGGRPGLTGSTRRNKIPLRSQDWNRLERVAAALSTPGFTPSAGQVASVLLSLAADSVASRLPERAIKGNPEKGRRSSL